MQMTMVMVVPHRIQYIIHYDSMTIPQTMYYHYRSLIHKLSLVILYILSCLILSINLIRVLLFTVVMMLTAYLVKEIVVRNVRHIFTSR